MPDSAGIGAEALGRPGSRHCDTAMGAHPAGPRLGAAGSTWCIDDCVIRPGASFARSLGQCAMPKLLAAVRAQTAAAPIALAGEIADTAPYADVLGGDTGPKKAGTRRWQKLRHRAGLPRI